MPSIRSSDTDHGGLDMAHHRLSDPPIKITRDIPLWGLISGICIVAVQAVTLWTQNQASLAKQTEMASDLRVVREKVDQISSRSIKLEAQLESMERRISLLEQRGSRP